MKVSIAKIFGLIALPAAVFAQLQIQTQVQNWSGFICKGGSGTIVSYPKFNLENKTLVNNNSTRYVLDNNYGLSIGYPWNTQYVSSSISSFSFTQNGNEIKPDMSGIYAWVVTPYWVYSTCGSYGGQIQMAYTSSVAEKLPINNINYFSDKKITMDIPGVNWADIHYRINGGQQLNYRLVKNGDQFTHKIEVPLSAPSEIDFTVTAELSSTGAAVESSKKGLVVNYITPDYVDHFNESQYLSNGFVFQPSYSNSVDWVIVHYSINGAAYENVNMLNSGYYFYYSIPQALVSGQTVKYFYTYSLNGQAKDSQITTTVIP